MPSDEIVDEELRAKVIKYENRIAKREAAGDDADAKEKRGKLKAFLEQEYKRDASRWVRVPAWAKARVFSRIITRADVSIDLSAFAESVRTKRGDDDPLPLDDVTHWADPTNIWIYPNRDGQPEVTDAATLEYEMRRKAEAEAEDALSLIHI